MGKAESGQIAENGVALAGDFGCRRATPTGSSGPVLPRVTGTLVAGLDTHHIAPHANVSYTQWFGRGTPAATSVIQPVSNSVGFAIGVSVAASGYVTIVERWWDGRFLAVAAFNFSKCPQIQDTVSWLCCH